MTYEEFTEKLKNDDKFLKLVIRYQFRYKSLGLVAKMYGLDESTFDKVFVEDPAFEEIYADRVRTEFTKIQRISAWPRINDALKTLAAVTSSDDESRAIQAASALVKAQRDLMALTKESNEDQEDELDKIWKEVEHENQQIESNKNS